MKCIVSINMCFGNSQKPKSGKCLLDWQFKVWRQHKYVCTEIRNIWLNAYYESVLDYYRQKWLSYVTVSLINSLCICVLALSVGRPYVFVMDFALLFCYVFVFLKRCQSKMCNSIQLKEINRLKPHLSIRNKYCVLCGKLISTYLSSKRRYITLIDSFCGHYVIAKHKFCLCPGQFKVKRTLNYQLPSSILVKTSWQILSCSLSLRKVT